MSGVLGETWGDERAYRLRHLRQVRLSVDHFVLDRGHVPAVVRPLAARRVGEPPHVRAGQRHADHDRTVSARQPCEETTLRHRYPAAVLRGEPGDGVVRADSPWVVRAQRFHERRLPLRGTKRNNPTHAGDPQRMEAHAPAYPGAGQGI
ncbi:hypothetical protein [Streptomyces sp. NPDC005336]|uniref:hypothetical protein n=1 Tax=unclassified Streptomyces TaxID=2593676 RepID=UPI0033A85560